MLAIILPGQVKDLFSPDLKIEVGEKTTKVDT